MLASLCHHTGMTPFFMWIQFSLPFSFLYAFYFTVLGMIICDWSSRIDSFFPVAPLPVSSIAALIICFKESLKITFPEAEADILRFLALHNQQSKSKKDLVHPLIG